MGLLDFFFNGKRKKVSKEHCNNEYTNQNAEVDNISIDNIDIAPSHNSIRGREDVVKSIESDLENAIKALEEANSIILNGESLKFLMGMGDFKKELQNIWKCGNLLVQYYEDIYGYGISSASKFFRTKRYETKAERNTTISQIVDDWDNVYLMLCNIGLTGFVNEAMQIRPLAKQIKDFDIPNILKELYANEK